ncbi:GNAT family N-acetyltransferase [Levilactobacillus parabrevis]|uniref:GNAT family N-acetyltransferase n=1 Tax=Levilactobacillus parabrevis TaxID=357278 RepID=UPI0021A3C0BE|nr:GNAT family N-acetyltransferase [Levilactobacillus parabrevis]
MTIAVSPSVANELPVLNAIYQEAQPYFQQIEGRDPLAPLGDIHAAIPEISVDRTHCLTLYHDEQIIGYAWTFAETSTNIYLLHFYISQANRRRDLGRACMQALGRQYRQQGLSGHPTNGLSCQLPRFKVLGCRGIYSSLLRGGAIGEYTH